jgi:hypothetical protein
MRLIESNERKNTTFRQFSGYMTKQSQAISGLKNHLRGMRIFLRPKCVEWRTDVEAGTG